MYKINITKLSHLNQRESKEILLREDMSESDIDQETKNLMDIVIEKYQNIINRSNSKNQEAESIRTLSARQSPFKNPYQSQALARNEFTTGLPKLNNNCYINSTVRALQIIFNEFGITLENLGAYSIRTKKIIDSLTQNQGVNIRDYYEFIQVLNSDGWGRGEIRDAKEFFTFLIEKLRIEGNRSLEGFFSSKIEKEHRIDCKTCNSGSYYGQLNIERFTDTVTIINITSHSVTESIFIKGVRVLGC